MAGVGRAAVSGPGQGGCFTPATALEQMHDMPVAVSCPDRRQGEWMQVTLLGDVTGGSHSASCQVLKPALCEEREPRTQNPATLREESGTHSAHTPNSSSKGAQKAEHPADWPRLGRQGQERKGPPRDQLCVRHISPKTALAVLRNSQVPSTLRSQLGRLRLKKEQSKGPSPGPPWVPLAFHS